MSDASESVLRVIEPQDQTSEVRINEQKPRGGRLRALARLSLGATLLAVETLSTQLQQLEQEATHMQPEERPIESVLIPADEWEMTLKHEMESPPRHVVLGFVLDTQSRISRTAGAILRQGDRVVRTVNRAFNPVLSSRALSPVRGPFESLVERGQAQVDHWRELGRTEEARSLALAQNATEQLVDTSMDMVSHDPRVQIFVQGFIQQQSLGMIDEAIEEVRERTITGDMLLERPVRSILRRPPRESLPPPTEIKKNLPRPSVKGRG